MFSGAPVPLAIGIYVQLVRKLELTDPEDQRVLRIVLSQRVRWRAYQQALGTDGAWRVGLDGQPVERVSAEHQAGARSALAVLQGKGQ